MLVRRSEPDMISLLFTKLAIINPETFYRFLLGSHHLKFNLLAVNGNHARSEFHAYRQIVNGLKSFVSELEEEAWFTNTWRESKYNQTFNWSTRLNKTINIALNNGPFNMVNNLFRTTQHAHYVCQGALKSQNWTFAGKKYFPLQKCIQMSHCVIFK